MIGLIDRFSHLSLPLKSWPKLRNTDLEICCLKLVEDVHSMLSSRLWWNLIWFEINQLVFFTKLRRWEETEQDSKPILFLSLPWGASPLQIHFLIGLTLERIHPSISRFQRTIPPNSFRICTGGPGNHRPTASYIHPHLSSVLFLVLLTQRDYGFTILLVRTDSRPGTAALIWIWKEKNCALHFTALHNRDLHTNICLLFGFGESFFFPFKSCFP